MGSPFVTLQRLVPQHALSRLVGRGASATTPWIKNTAIKLFARQYGVNLTEALLDQPEDYVSFNDFFTRALKPGARPLDEGFVCPADGAVSACGTIDGNQIFQAKGRTYSIEQLIGKPAGDFRDGSFLTVYLSPKDYHRVHVPWAGHLREATYIPGTLFSVNAETVEHVPGLFARNERMVAFFETDRGPMAVIMVGAMIVAGVRPTWRDTAYSARLPVTEYPDIDFERGGELGAFELGSTAIVLTSWPVAWTVGAGQSVRMGQAVAS